jgi:acetyl-CoA C-acetyltransferase
MPAVIVGYARTPFARFTGVFAQVPATALGAHAVAAALERAGVRPDQVDRVVGGQVLQAGAGQNPARQSAVGAGIPLTVPAITLNAVCLSGLEAVAEGARMIEDGRAQIVVAVGQESMSLAPHAWPGSRLGKRYGSIEFLDTMDHDGLTDAFEHRSMGASTEEHNAEHAVTRQEQDAWAADSHARLEAGAAFLETEIAPFTTPGRRGTTIATDDGLRPGTTADTLATLAPAFHADGGITAGNSSQITDGAAAVVLMDERLHERRDSNPSYRPLARVRTSAMVAGPDVSLHAQPANATLKALELAGRSAADLRAVEINEAFAAVAVVSTRLLDVDPAIVNPYGGAIALGHPIGASGTRIAGHLARRLGPGELGVAAICGGGGQGAALLLEGMER